MSRKKNLKKTQIFLCSKNGKNISRKKSRKKSKKYPRKYPNSSVTELDREKLRVATSTEGMNILSGKEKKVSLNFFFTHAALLAL